MTDHQRRFDDRPPAAMAPRRRAFHWTLASIIGMIAALAMSSANTLADITQCYCYDETNSTRYEVDYSPLWYAALQTGNPYVFETLGAKGNLTTGGIPVVFDSANQHVDTYVSSMESSYTSWIQTGWALGEYGLCSSETQTSGIEVYVEIHDDTGPSSYCTSYLYGPAPSNASYDARYYGRDGAYYQYRAYYQAPGSSTIQYMGWGDFNNQYTSQVAQSEVLARPAYSGQVPDCPIVGNISGGHWNLLGNPNSNTFAGYLQLYTGSSWVDWTSTHQSVSRANAPYQIQSISGFREVDTGGGQQ